MVTAVVRNVGRADAARGTASFYLYVNGTLTTRGSVTDSVSMGGFTGFVWRFRMPRRLAGDGERDRGGRQRRQPDERLGGEVDSTLRHSLKTRRTFP
jgi:hypothetical protein